MSQRLRSYSTYKDVAAEAGRLLSASGSPRLPNGIAIDVERIAKDYCGFDVAEIPDLNLGGPVLGAFIPEFDLIMLKENCIFTRRRFSLAHEIGHAQLEHKFGANEGLFGPQKAMYFRCEDGDIAGGDDVRKRRPRAEILADKFAAHLLMPESLVREIWRTAFSERDTADMLMVSQQAMDIRLRQLGLRT